MWETCHGLMQICATKLIMKQVSKFLKTIIINGSQIMTIKRITVLIAHPSIHPTANPGEGCCPPSLVCVFKCLLGSVPQSVIVLMLLPLVTFPVSKLLFTMLFPVPFVGLFMVPFVAFTPFLIPCAPVILWFFSVCVCFSFSFTNKPLLSQSR